MSKQVMQECPIRVISLVNSTVYQGKNIASSASFLLKHGHFNMINNYIILYKNSLTI
jgi:hypothetical protein